MKKEILSEDFFNRSTPVVARELLGKCLVRKQGKKIQVAVITEVEVYDGVSDKACHAHKGETPRTVTMFGPPGHWYVYLIYGIYHMLNIVTREEGYPAAVLIRGIAPLEAGGAAKLDGPGKLTKALEIDKTVNGQKAVRGSGLWIEDRGITISDRAIKKTPRIGVDYAGEWAKKKWRFVWVV